jgi:hypothetical protein
MRIILLSFFLISSIVSFSCTCRKLEEIAQDEIEKIGEAFIGKIKSVSKNDSNQTISATFEVTKYLKGKKFNTEITVTTSNSEATCGLIFKDGQKWYVYAVYNENELHASLCGRSVQLTKVSAKAKRIFIGRKNYRTDKRRFRTDKKAILKFTKNAFKTK